MIWHSELITWAVPGVTWMLAFIAYIVLRVVEKQPGLKRSPDSIRRRAEKPGQARHPGSAGPGFAGPGFAGTEYPGAQHTGSQPATQS